MPYCPKCGEAVHAGDAFCMECGEAVDTVVSDPEPREPQAETENPGRASVNDPGRGRSEQRSGQDPIESVAASNVRTEGAIESLQTKLRISALDSLSWGWNFLTAHPTSFAAFAVVAVLFVVGQAIGPTATAVTGLVGLLGLAVATGILINGVSSVDAGDPFDLGALFGRTRGSLPVAIVAGAIWGLVVTVGLVLLILPGVYLMVRFAFIAHFVFLDDAGPIEAFRASWGRTAGNFVPILAVVIALLLAEIVLNLIPILGIGIVTLTVTPLGIATLTHMYLDLEPERAATPDAA